MKRYKYGTDVDEEHIKERYMSGPRHNCVYACQMTRGQCVQRKKDAKTTGEGEYWLQQLCVLWCGLSCTCVRITTRVPDRCNRMYVTYHWRCYNIVKNNFREHNDSCKIKPFY